MSAINAALNQIDRVADEGDLTAARQDGALPAADDAGSVRLVDSAFVRAMREGWVVMIDEVNTIRDVALLSINAGLDGRLTLYLPATGDTVVA